MFIREKTLHRDTKQADRQEDLPSICQLSYVPVLRVDIKWTSPHKRDNGYTLDY